MESTKDRRKKYMKMERKGFTMDEMIQVMPDDELEMNARRGGELAKEELKRRAALSSLKTTLDDKPLDLGV